MERRYYGGISVYGWRAGRQTHAPDCCEELNLMAVVHRPPKRQRANGGRNVARAQLSISVGRCWLSRWARCATGGMGRKTRTSLRK